MDVLEAIANRRSVRYYRPDPIDDKILNTVLEAARWAPSWGNTQCRRVIFRLVLSGSFSRQRACSRYPARSFEDGAVATSL